MNAPFLKLRRNLPLDVPPSGKMQIEGNLYPASMRSYLSVIYLMFSYLSSSDAPLATNIHCNAYVKSPMTGFVLRDFFDANEGIYFEAIRIKTSVHEQ
jgi:hypothetical protein